MTSRNLNPAGAKFSLSDFMLTFILSGIDQPQLPEGRIFDLPGKLTRVQQVAHSAWVQASEIKWLFNRETADHLVTEPTDTTPRLQ